jgi:hypothetical protein
MCIPGQEVAYSDLRCPSSGRAVGFVEHARIAGDVVTDQGPGIAIGAAVECSGGWWHVWMLLGWVGLHVLP